jgi:hypothetical protein
MNKLIAVVALVLVSSLNLLFMAGAALLAATGDGGGKGVYIVFGVGCVFIALFALVDIVHIYRAQKSRLSLLAVPAAIGFLVLLIVGTNAIGVKLW